MAAHPSLNRLAALAYVLNHGQQLGSNVWMARRDGSVFKASSFVSRVGQFLTFQTQPVERRGESGRSGQRQPACNCQAAGSGG